MIFHGLVQIRTPIFCRILTAGGKHVAANEIHLGDIGTVLTVTLKDGDDIVDISSATTKQFILEKPSGTTLTKPTDFVTDGTDGKEKYTIIAGDLDEVGLWQIQPYTILPNWTGRSDIGTFMVHPNL